MEYITRSIKHVDGYSQTIRATVLERNVPSRLGSEDNDLGRVLGVGSYSRLNISLRGTLKVVQK